MEWLVALACLAFLVTVAFDIYSVSKHLERKRDKDDSDPSS